MYSTNLYNTDEDWTMDPQDKKWLDALREFMGEWFGSSPVL